MCFDPPTECDTEFVKLLTGCDEVNLTRLALEFARDAYPDLSFGPTLDWIAERGDELTRSLHCCDTTGDVLRELSSLMVAHHRVSGCPSCFERADGSFLNRVVESRRGIPISLSLLYQAVADRAGLELSGIAAPHRFLLRCESGREDWYIDPFAGGEILRERECVAKLSELSGLSEYQIIPTLDPASPRTIAVRMLTNLKVLYLHQKNWQSAWVVQHRLTSLFCRSYQQRRDLAIISVMAKRPGQGLDLLTSLLEDCPAEERETLTRYRFEAERQLACCN